MGVQRLELRSAMTGFSSTYSPKGSGAIISGSFGVVNYVEDILRVYDDVLMDILKSTAEEAQVSMREQARTSDTGWADIADAISVEYNHDNRQFSYTIVGDETTQGRAMDLEYGNGHLAPTPFLRGTILQQQDKQTDAINSRLRQTLVRSVGG